MPCQGGPTNEELAFAAAMKDPIYAAIQREKWRLMDIERNKKHKLRIEEEERVFQDELTNHTLENIFFKSSMTVFLCRTLQIVISNFGYKFLPEEFEWWWHEHGWRDTHNDQSNKNPGELARKLIEISKKYYVGTKSISSEFLIEDIIEEVKRANNFVEESGDISILDGIE